jgi:hypothetical protein
MMTDQIQLEASKKAIRFLTIIRLLHFNLGHDAGPRVSAAADKQMLCFLIVLKYELISPLPLVV